jgi:hypothetical protein
MSNRKRLKAGVLLFTALLVCVPQIVWVPGSAAITINIKARAKSRISIKVGGGNISTVEFTVPVTTLGNGLPITGSPSIQIRLVIRGPAGTPITGTLSADSISHPLTNSNGNTLPFSDISWVASDGDIPTGAFNEDANQILATFQSSNRIIDYLTFSYANTRDAAAGTYNGRIVYTWSAP